MNCIERFFVARWLARLPEADMDNPRPWLLGIANSLPGRRISALGRVLFRAAERFR